MKPILFSTPMVQAILAGNKTQTRRVIKPQPTYLEISGAWIWLIPKSKIKAGCCECVCTASREWWEYLLPEQMPYQRGDILWVREKWRQDECQSCRANQGEPCPFESCEKADGSIPCFPLYYDYAADCDKSYIESHKWKPSIFMPKEAARLFLRVTNVKAEKLRDITIADAQAEGNAFMWNDKTAKLICENVKTKNSYIAHFAGLWDSINAKRDGGAYAWANNPWVWVYEFEVVDKP